MHARVLQARRLSAQILPKGPLDAFRQIGMFIGAYLLYQVVRGLVNGNDVGKATWNATKVIILERKLHVFVEPSIQKWALNSHWLMDVATWAYLNVNYAVTGVVLLWIYLRRNDSFYFLRNTYMIAMLIALVGYTVYPTAPPRLMPEWGFTDVVQQVTGVTAEHGSAAALLNLYAAIPSMHVCFALLTGIPMARLSRRRWARALWAFYPVFIIFVVISTGNHYITDVVLGGVTAGVAALAAKQLLARVRPRVWAFSPAAVTDGTA
jgi:membrane-associated phospholipid phosphatase